MKIALVQFMPTLGDVPGNLSRLAGLVRTAARNGAKLIVCPELALSGYSFLSTEEARRCSERPSDFHPESGNRGTSMGLFHSIAKDHGTHVVWGFIEESATGRLFNSQMLMCPDGTFESYSKINLFSADWIWATPGKSSPPVRRIQVGGESRRVGLLICRDVRDKSDGLKSFYEPGDADVVCLSTAWGRGAFPATAWMDFAASNKVVLAVANRYGAEVPNDFGFGGVCIIRPDQTVFCEGLIWNQDCIVFGDV